MSAVQSERSVIPTAEELGFDPQELRRKYANLWRDIMRGVGAWVVGPFETKHRAAI